jgi:hypothetical protein
MFRKRVSLSALVVCCAVLGFAVAKADTPSAADVRVIPVSQSQTYTVYYYNVRFPHSPHIWGTYGRWVDAVRAANFINSFPEYRAYIR